MARRRMPWSVFEARRRFADLVEAARSAPQVVTKTGAPLIVVLAVEEYDRLRARQRPMASFADHLLAMPKDDGEFERVTIEPRDIEF